jgi:hypothetical protein
MGGQAPPAAMEHPSPISTDKVCQQTPQLMPDPGSGESLHEGGDQRNQSSTRTQFEGQFRTIFAALQKEYARIHLPDPEEVAKIAFNVRISADPRLA